MFAGGKGNENALQMIQKVPRVDRALIDRNADILAYIVNVVGKVPNDKFGSNRKIESVRRCYLPVWQLLQLNFLAVIALDSIKRRPKPIADFYYGDSYRAHHTLPRAKPLAM